MKRAFCLILILTSLIYTDTFPRIANYFLDYNITMQEIDSLALCDVLILDHEVGHSRKEVIDSIRARNPHITILAYIVSQEIQNNATEWNGSLRKSLYEGISDDWWLKNSKGEKIVFWPGTSMLNIAAGTPEKSSIQWNRYFATFCMDSILATNIWDGLYLDNCWHSVSWLDSTMDIDNDGTADPAREIDSLWEVGMDLLLELIRERHPETIIMGNGGYRYGDKLNGALFETFPVWGGWMRLMDTYWSLDTTAVSMQLNCINSNTHNTGDKTYQQMRFGLTSTLLGDGYFSYDFGADDHSQHWWFDEYTLDLGKPLGKAYAIGGDILLDENFSTHGSTLKLGDWKMSCTVVDSGSLGAHLKAVVSGEEEWNEIVRSMKNTTDDSIYVGGSFRLNVVAADSLAEIYALMRVGSDYADDISLVTIPVYEGLDTIISFYSDSLALKKEYALLIGSRKGGTFLIDDITWKSDKGMVYARDFEQGKVLCNPSARAEEISLGSGWSTFKGKQDPIHNSGKSVVSVTLQSQDGILLLRETPINNINKAVFTSKIITVQGKSISITGVDNGEVLVVDVRGKILLIDSVKQQQAISLQDLASGYYFVSVRSLDGVTLDRQKIFLP